MLSPTEPVLGWAPDEGYGYLRGMRLVPCALVLLTFLPAFASADPVPAPAVAPSLMGAPPGAVAPSLMGAPPGAVAPSLMGAPPGAVAPRLTLEQATSRARSSGFDVLVAKASERAAVAEASSANVWQNPAVSVGFGKAVRYTQPAGCSACSPWMYTVSASDQGLLFDLVSGKRALRSDLVDARTAQASATRKDVERILIAGTKQAYARAVMAHRAVDFTRGEEMSLEKARTLARVRFPKVINDGELARVEAEFLSAANQSDRARGELNEALISLGYFLGLDADAPLPAVDEKSLDYAVPSSLAQANEASLLAMALAHRSDLALAEASARAAQATARVERRSRVPDIALSATYQQQGTDGAQSIQPPTLSVALTGSVPIFSQNSAGIARADGLYEASLAEASRLKAAINADVRAGLARLGVARTRVERMNTSLLPARKRALDVVRVQYENGAAPLMDWLDAQRTYAAANREFLDALRDYWTAVFALEQAIGTELR